MTHDKSTRSKKVLAVGGLLAGLLSLVGLGYWVFVEFGHRLNITRSARITAAPDDPRPQEWKIEGQPDSVTGEPTAREARGAVDIATFPGKVYRPGYGVTVPRLVRRVEPLYTEAALRAKVQGAVLVEAVVLPDGTVGDVKVLRSLDRKFGLDEEAIKAARQWRFTPGVRSGEPVAVLVTIELTFTLR